MAAEVQRQEVQNPSHMDHIIQSGFTMNDIKGLHRFGEEGVEADEMALQLNPSRPPRRGSVNRGSPNYDLMTRSTSAMDIDNFHMDGEDKAEKKRGRSPFKFFRKSQSKDKHKSKSPPDRNRGRGTCNFSLTKYFILKYKFLFGNSFNF